MSAIKKSKNPTTAAICDSLAPTQLRLPILKEEILKYSENTPYIKSAEMNGKRYTKNYISHFDIRNGGGIRFNMSDKPNQKRGVEPNDAPSSMTQIKNLKDSTID